MLHYDHTKTSKYTTYSTEKMVAAVQIRKSDWPHNGHARAHACWTSVPCGALLYGRMLWIRPP
jgi:hypothetical protein